MRKDNGEGQRTMESTKVIYLYGVVDHAEAPASFAELDAPPGVRCLPIGELGALDPGRPLQEFGEEALHERNERPQVAGRASLESRPGARSGHEIRDRHPHEAPHDF